MKSILLASAALVAMIGHAEAQEAGYNWSGFYVGAQAGYGWSTAEFNGTSAVPAGDHDDDGFVGGVYVGHDWQAGNFVFGALADIDYIDVDELQLEGFTNGPFGQKDEAYTYDIDWLATARVRAGFLPTDRLLVYGTGGLAFAHVKTSGLREGFGGSEASGSDVQVGGVAGLGAEFAVTNNWSVKTEYLHYDFNGADVFAGGDGGPSFDPSVDTVKVGLTFRFGP